MNKRLLILIGICLGIAAIAMIFSAVNIALASIQKDLSASITQLQWVVNTQYNFMHGYHYGIWLLLFVCITGLTMALLMKKSY